MRAKLLLVVTTLILGACGNKVEVPSNISGSVKVEDSTHTIRHEIVVSAEMTSLFESTCIAEATAQGLQEPLRSEYVKLCVAKATQEFIAGILAMIEANKEQ